MKVFVALLFLTAVSAFSLPALKDVETEWTNFKTTYNKVYKNLIEEKLRRAVFAENYKLISEHNQRYELGLESFTLKLNKFADSTAEETRFLRGYKKSSKQLNAGTFQSNPLTDLPDTFDWGPKGAVTDVKDQASCGSCWAFSTTGSLEAQYFFKTGKLVEISEQNLVDCSTENDGCDGGDMLLAFNYINQNDGIDSEESYPYTAEDGDCQYDVANNVTSISGYVLLEEGNEDKLKEAVVTVGPISVAIDASSWAFQFYDSGIYAPANCKSANDELDHAVLVVGYGSESGKDYWLVKNSWTTDWGIDGYIKMIRNDNNHCGIATEACYPLMY